jgi:hypothetical protein
MTLIMGYTMHNNTLTGEENEAMRTRGAHYEWFHEKRRMSVD